MIHKQKFEKNLKALKSGLTFEKIFEEAGVVNENIEKRWRIGEKDEDNKTTILKKHKFGKEVHKNWFLKRDNEW